MHIAGQILKVLNLTQCQQMTERPQHSKYLQSLLQQKGYSAYVNRNLSWMATQQEWGKSSSTCAEFEVHSVVRFCRISQIIPLF